MEKTGRGIKLWKNFKKCVDKCRSLFYNEPNNRNRAQILPQCTKELISKEKVQIHRRENNELLKMKNHGSERYSTLVQKKKWKSTKDEVEETTE